MVALIIILLLSITFHEYAHGWMAYKLGDPTPRDRGRLTLNPLAHIDPFGTVVLPILLLILSRGTFSFGAAKPVPINPYHFKNPKRDMRWVGLAGPSTNLLIALLLALFLKAGVNKAVSDILITGILLNLILAIFNLLPIPPLDGSRVLMSFLPNRLAHKYLKLEPYGLLIVFALIIMGFFRWFILPLVALIFKYILGIEIIF